MVSACVCQSCHTCQHQNGIVCKEKNYISLGERWITILWSMKLLSSMEWRREYPVQCLQKKIFASLWSLVTQVVLVFTIFLSQQYFKREKENIPFTVFRMQVGVKQQFTNNATTKMMLERPWANRISENVLIDLNGFVYNSFSQIIL